MALTLTIAKRGVRRKNERNTFYAVIERANIKLFVTNVQNLLKESTTYLATVTVANDRILYCGNFMFKVTLHITKSN